MEYAGTVNVKEQLKLNVNEAKLSPVFPRNLKVS